jgi:hypothetical protein
MIAAEFGEFEAIIRQLEKVFGKKIDDETVRAYWNALKDQSLPSVRRHAEDYLKRNKFFPKPFELRPKEERKLVRDAAADAAFQEAEARCIRNLNELRRQDPIEWQKRVTLGKLDRLIATTHESHPAYQQILNEWRAARGIHVGEGERLTAREALEEGP